MPSSLTTIKLSSLPPSALDSQRYQLGDPDMSTPPDTLPDLDDDQQYLLSATEGCDSDEATGTGHIGTVRKYDNVSFSASFFLFGLLNNVLYVIILSAALDLVPADVPTGVILLADITPSLMVKIGWPYLLSGPVRYKRRVISCSTISFLGMMIIVIFQSVTMRILGISLASFSSGLGEMTFLQLSTTYARRTGVSWFASGTGAAGVFGAGLWWLLRNLGVQIGLGISSVLPICLALVYLFLLPSSLQDVLGKHRLSTTEGYAALVNSGDSIENLTEQPKTLLTLNQKLRLARPLILPFMLPLFTVYFAEYTINTGIAPTLLYQIPAPDHYPIFSHVFKSLRDYYPFWQLTYQIFVFFSRSSIAICRLPPLPKRLIPLPSLFQVILFCIILLESSNQTISQAFGPNFIYAVIFSLISLEGVCGGLAYVSAFHWLSQEDDEQEFKIGCVGFADTIGILGASLFSSWLEPRLCGIQVSQGRTLCRDVAKLTGHT
ncbi:hypothetical protein CROQUDRAFT_74956 [Cronartium quercuum f. sp. fusiforme G11]|uniref:Protein BTN n=1 Tax=Cronartium quercuum f. sp. fusiforme G11 TaxID=708437 RepID=A0A9P6NML8_9BASI|nr:hypothetical protein CROQUDRAFT_74956 [Cronartium quercuum f. sp. fusiforme G11]